MAAAGALIYWACLDEGRFAPLISVFAALTKGGIFAQDLYDIYGHLKAQSAGKANKKVSTTVNWTKMVGFFVFAFRLWKCLEGAAWEGGCWAVYFKPRNSEKTIADSGEICRKIAE